MKNPSNYPSIVLLSLAISLAACTEQAAGGADDSDRLGVVELDLLVVPASVRCVVVNTASTVSTSTPFSVTGGATNVTFTLGRLALGQTTFTGEAYDQACGSTAGQTPTWIADSSSALLKPGIITNLAMTFRRNNPVMATASFTDNIKAIALGDGKAIAIAEDGAAFHWGNVPTLFTTNVPTAVPASTMTPKDVRIGWDHLCWIDQSDLVHCFGGNTYGQLGHGLATPPAGGPVVASVGAAVAVGAGNQFSCAVRTAGDVVCWGRNNMGQLGNGTTTNSTTPVGVSGLNNVARIAVGNAHVCALTRRGQVYCWGSNDNAQLGLGTISGNQLTAAIVPGEEPVTALGAGQSITCSLRVDGTVRCWGNGSEGAIGDGSNMYRYSPTLAAVGMDAVDISVTGRSVCALRANRTVVCWGYNIDGQLGDETTVNRLSPTPVIGLPPSGVDRIGLSNLLGRSQCAFVVGGGTWCWGRNFDGEIGDGTNIYRFVATPVKL